MSLQIVNAEYAALKVEIREVEIIRKHAEEVAYDEPAAENKGAGNGNLRNYKQTERFRSVCKKKIPMQRYSFFVQINILQKLPLLSAVGRRTLLCILIVTEVKNVQDYH
jgi:hypothetical protein